MDELHSNIKNIVKKRRGGFAERRDQEKNP